MTDAPTLFASLEFRCFLLGFFDLCFVLLTYLFVGSQSCNSSGDLETDFISREARDYSFSSSLFDAWLVGVARSLLLQIYHALLRRRSGVPLIAGVLLSSIFFVVKAVVLYHPIVSYELCIVFLIVTFLFGWFELMYILRSTSPRLSYQPLMTASPAMVPAVAFPPREHAKTVPPRAAGLHLLPSEETALVRRSIATPVSTHNNNATGTGTGTGEETGASFGGSGRGQQPQEPIRPPSHLQQVVSLGPNYPVIATPYPIHRQNRYKATLSTSFSEASPSALPPAGVTAIHSASDPQADSAVVLSVTNSNSNSNNRSPTVSGQTPESRRRTRIADADAASPETGNAGERLFSARDSYEEDLSEIALTAPQSPELDGRRSSSVPATPQRPSSSNRMRREKAAASVLLKTERAASSSPSPTSSAGPHHWPSPVTNSYWIEVAAYDAFLELRTAVQDLPSWNIVGMKKGVQILTRQVQVSARDVGCSSSSSSSSSAAAAAAAAGAGAGATLHAMAGRCRFRRSPKQVATWLMDIRSRKRYDEMCLDQTYVERASEIADVVHVAFSAPIPIVSPRDFVHCRGLFVDDNGMDYFLSAKSVWHPDVPNRPDYVRGEIHVGGFCVRAIPVGQNLPQQKRQPQEQPQQEAPAHEGDAAEDRRHSSDCEYMENECEVIYVAIVDAKGSLPATVVKLSTTKQPLVLAKIRELLDA